jgi:hypothetical protein
MHILRKYLYTMFSTLNYRPLLMCSSGSCPIRESVYNSHILFLWCYYLNPVVRGPYVSTKDM